MISLTFTTQNHPEWNKKIDAGLVNTLNTLTSQKETFKPHRIYAQSNNIFVGGLTLEQHGDILWIDALWVDETDRNKGIGQQLIQQALLYASQHSAKELQLNTFFSESHTFFLSQGFEDVVIIPNWKYGLTCYLMRKQI